MENDERMGHYLSYLRIAGTKKRERRSNLPIGALWERILLWSQALGFAYRRGSGLLATCAWICLRSLRTSVCVR